MQTSSANYKTAIAATDRDIRGYLKFNNTFTMTGADGLISFKTTQNAMDAERFCVGSTTSCFCEASFYNSGLEGSGVSLANSYFDAYCGVVTDADTDTVEYICCGRYWISEITRGKETTRIVGYDIAGRLSMDYVPTVTAGGSGYLVMDILNDIIDQTGVNGGTHFTTYGDSTYVSEIYQGNCRAQWGWLCSLVDAEAASYTATRDPADLGYLKKYVAGNGELNPYAVNETTTYLDGASFGDEYTITSFTTGTTDTPIVIGNGTGVYGLNPYMDNATATTIEGTVDNYQYYPATLHWRGDPCLDVLDEIVVTQGADTYKMLAMKIETTFNGGLEQTINCFGDSEEYYALSTSPTQSQINQVSNLVQEIQQAIETADGGVITKILDVDGTWKELVIANNQDLSQATSVWRFNINGLAHSDRYQGGTYTLAMDTQGRIVANVIQTGILQDANGNNSWNLDTGAFTITNGSLNITTNSNTYDVIKFQNNEWQNSFSPLELRTINTNTKNAMVIQAGGIFVHSNYGEANDVTRAGLSQALNLYDTSGLLRTLIEHGQMIQYDANNNYRHILNGEGKLYQYDTNGKMRTRIEYGDIYLKDASELTRTHINSQGVLEQFDANGKMRTYLEYGDIYLKNASEVTRTHLNSQGELEQFDTSSVRRTYLGWGDLYLYDATPTVRTHLDPTGKAEFKDSSGKLRVQINSDGTVGAYNSSGTLQTKLQVMTGVSWHQGRSGAALVNSASPSASAYIPVVSTKGTASDWSIGTLANDLYVVNATDACYNGNTNRVLRYRFPYIDTSSGSTLAYDILSTGNTNDRVIAQGTVGNPAWNYRKWASGTYEIWRRVSQSVAITSAWGTWYYGSVPRVTYPVTFTAAPLEQVTFIAGSGWASLCGGTAQTSTTQSAQYYLVRPSSSSSGTYYFDFYVRGTV